uniref:Colipase n=1 Tax=Sus scrofa TaxID=9823 RepID=A0A8D0JZT9_PIG
MEKVLALLLVTLTVAYAVPDPRGIIINLDEGELCLNSAQCKSNCCQHDTILSLSRCALKARENSECSAFVSASGGGGERAVRRRKKVSSEGMGPQGLGVGSRRVSLDVECFCFFFWPRLQHAEVP